MLGNILLRLIMSNSNSATYVIFGLTIRWQTTSLRTTIKNKEEEGRLFRRKFMHVSRVASLAFLDKLLI